MVLSSLDLAMLHGRIEARGFVVGMLSVNKSINFGIAMR
jgi:hypothetical protein